jgi:hypothetical protein
MSVAFCPVLKLVSSVACSQELSLERFFLISLILFQVLECRESYVHIRALPPPRPPLSFLSLFNLSLFSTSTLAETFFLKKRLFFRFPFHLLFPRPSPLMFFFKYCLLFFFGIAARPFSFLPTCYPYFSSVTH